MKVNMSKTLKQASVEELMWAAMSTAVESAHDFLSDSINDALHSKDTSPQDVISMLSKEHLVHQASIFLLDVLPEQMRDLFGKQDEVPCREGETALMWAMRCTMMNILRERQDLCHIDIQLP
jgi:hypothetical protein